MCIFFVAPMGWWTSFFVILLVLKTQTCILAPTVGNGTCNCDCNTIWYITLCLLMTVVFFGWQTVCLCIIDGWQTVCFSEGFAFISHKACIWPHIPQMHTWGGTQEMEEFTISWKMGWIPTEETQIKLDNKYTPKPTNWRQNSKLRQQWVHSQFKMLENGMNPTWKNTI